MINIQKIFSGLQAFSRSSISAGFLLLFCASATAQQLAMPKYDVVDKFGISGVSGEINYSVDTVSIGGSLGLSHKVSVATNTLISQIYANSGNKTNRGFTDTFGGNALYTEVNQSTSGFEPNNAGIQFTDYNSGVYLMRVHDHTGSASFMVMVGSSAVGKTDRTSGYAYKNLCTTCHSTLTIPTNKPGYLLWTKEDGTQVWYLRDSSGGAVAAGAPGALEKIVYPNGFTLSFTHPDTAKVSAVSTNTGFTLKYNYVHEWPVNLGLGSGIPNQTAPAENNAVWSKENPKSIIAINQAMEYCDPGSNSLCVSTQESCPTLDSRLGQSCKQLNESWPTAKFIWPAGMPRALFVGDSKVSVIDSANRPTEFRLASSGDINAGYPPELRAALGKKFAPRLLGIKDGSSTAENVTYEIENGRTDPSGAGPIYTAMWSGNLVKATGILGSRGYQVSAPQGPNLGSLTRTLGDEISVSNKIYNFGAIGTVTMHDSYIRFQPGYSTLPEYSYSSISPSKTYSYYGEQVSKIAYNGVFEQAFFPPLPCANVKTCYKPTSVRDAKGNITDYTYHEPSGQLATVTKPANKNGVRAQTRYTYEQKYANYYHVNGAPQAGTPIWLKTAERYCINSNASGGVCANNDEVVTRYEYQHDNLLLTGMTVTDPQGATLRTCYQYDIYGNRIGETQPKAKLTSCN